MKENHVHFFFAHLKKCFKNVSNWNLVHGDTYNWKTADRFADIYRQRMSVKHVANFTWYLFSFNGCSALSKGHSTNSMITFDIYLDTMMHMLQITITNERKLQKKNQNNSKLMQIKNHTI